MDDATNLRQDLLDARLSWLTVPVADLPGMTAWYRDALGLPLHETDERAAYFRLGTLPFELYCAEPVPAGTARPLWLFLEVTDLEATRQALAARGVVRDPEGNEWRLTTHVMG